MRVVERGEWVDAATKEVIAVTNGHYKDLLSGKSEAGKLWIPSK